MIYYILCHKKTSIFSYYALLLLSLCPKSPFITILHNVFFPDTDQKNGIWLNSDVATYATESLGIKEIPAAVTTYICKDITPIYIVEKR